ncbi:predicted protein [Naegleria gruberi]|uniref:Predicted protein n=1 Tax=Naegleria gruberi TaxID=5762 RepID=D2VXU2_NAEGR|nr:uncharacterized protein NAEGRDRAFT_73874 [Naegleria gruberi]EFC38351.1 predicted protein [Naegleria gruberi]|eukprot:XP_002671095.1 predicted protein [Naegleria gruberi strain NEG-M]
MSTNNTAAASSNPIGSDEDLYLRSLFAHNSPEACSSLFRAANEEKKLKGIEGGFHTLYVGCLLKVLTKAKEPLNYCLPSFIKNPGTTEDDEEATSVIKMKKVNECIGMDVETTTHILGELDRVVSRKPAEVLGHLNSISSNLNSNGLQINSSDSVDMIRNKVKSAVESNCMDCFSEIDGSQSIDSQAYSMFKSHLCLFASVCKKQFQSCLTSHTTHRGFSKCLEESAQMECFKLYKDVEF